ncbi:MAG: HAMP domain-containing histidine kinase [Verrucomicrobiaceae bacterium]|nr:MAG: HAMP domain-containing histidine kinase [Verrucomicrobiaceae bacterium]
MRLAEFILTGMEKILMEWEASAGSLYAPKAQMTSAGLRDHAREILQAVAADLRTGRTAESQSGKSRGPLFPPPGAPETAGRTRSLLRARSGMDINQLASECRALRASVLRLWAEDGDHEPDGESLRDVIRFNEVIDQALCEFMVLFSEQVDRSRHLLLGMLGHDMRSPLSAIALTAEYLAELHAGEDVSEAALCLIQSGGDIKALLDDLVDFNRRSLGLGISIEAAPMDLGAVCASEVGQHRAAHPGSRTELALEGNLQGHWDGPRLRRVLRNLLSNARARGTAGEPVRVTVTGDEKGVCLEVKNTGPAFDPATAQDLFEPMKRGVPAANPACVNGLGLYIVREIAHAHGGKAAVRCQGPETVFSVCLPRASGGTDAGARK